MRRDAVKMTDDPGAALLRFQPGAVSDGQCFPENTPPYSDDSAERDHVAEAKRRLTSARECRRAEGKRCLAPGEIRADVEGFEDSGFHSQSENERTALYQRTTPGALTQVK